MNNICLQHKDILMHTCTEISIKGVISWTIKLALVLWNKSTRYENMMQLSDAKPANPQQNSVYLKESVYSEAAAKKGMFKSNGQRKDRKYSWKTKWCNKLD